MDKHQLGYVKWAIFDDDEQIKDTKPRAKINKGCITVNI